MSGTGSGASGGSSTGGGASVALAGSGISVSQVTPKVIVHFPYNINSQIVSFALTGSGSLTQNNAMAEVHSGAASSSSSFLTSNHILEFNSGKGGFCLFSGLFDTGVAGNSQLMGLGTDDNGLFFGYDGTSFGVLYRSNSVDNWIPQSSWNKDKMDGTGPSDVTIDPQSGNQFQVRYVGFGFGNIYFYIQDPISAEAILVHQINYANQNTVPVLFNPSFAFYCLSQNTSNTTDIVPKVASLSLYEEGLSSNVPQVRQFALSTKSVTTREAVLTIRNKTTYQGINNHVQCELKGISISTEGNKSVNIIIVANTTLGGIPSYTDVDTATSVMEFDDSGTTVTGGGFLSSFTVGATDSVSLNLTDDQLFLGPGKTFTIAASSDNANLVFVDLNWEERFS